MSSPTSLIKSQLKVGYPSLFTHKICDYKRAQTGVISSSIESFDWKKYCFGENVGKQAALFNKMILNNFHNFIPVAIC